MELQLSERKIKILQAIIRNYLETGEPVGSRTISKYTDLNLSSATIRNEMSDLEEMGYIVQPHTSAGRIPSDMGYRLYVDTMMEEKDRELEELKEMMLEKEDKMDHLLKQVAKLLAANTNYVSMISAPTIHTNKIKFIQLSRMDAGQILAVVVAEGNVIQSINRMQQFLGMNISYTPFNVIMGFVRDKNAFSIGVVVIAFLIPILSGLTQWYSTKLVSANQPAQPSGDGSQGMGAEMMKSMNVTMPLMSVFFCFSFPLGIGVYWVISSLLQVIQQIGVNKYLSKVDIDDLIAKNVEKANKKRAKKGLPPTKINGNASQTLKRLQEAEAKEEAEKNAKMEKVQKTIKESTEYYNQNAKPGSLAAKAAMVQKYNEKHEKRSK